MEITDYIKKVADENGFFNIKENRVENQELSEEEKNNAYLKELSNPKYRKGTLFDTFTPGLTNRSKYDDEIDWNESTWASNDINDKRAEAQGFTGRLLDSSINNITIASTTLASTTVGTLGGIISAGIQGDFSKVWDNDFNRFANRIQENAIQNRPIYEGEEYENKSFLGKLTDNIFWAELWQNAGYMEGMIVPGMALGGAAKALNVSQKFPFLTKVVANALVASGEASMEAINNKNEQYEKLFNQATDLYKSKLSKTNDANEQKEIYDEYVRDLSLIENDVIKQGNRIFAGNMIILTTTGLLEFGDFVSRGYGESHKLLKQITRNELGQATARGVANDVLRGTGQFLKNSFVEGIEEYTQRGAASGAANTKKANDFLSKYSDELDIELADNYLQAMGKAWVDDFNNEEAWLEFISGAILGGVGLPGSHNGVRAQISDALKEGKSRRELADKINKKEKELGINSNDLKNNGKLQEVFDFVIRNNGIKREQNNALFNRDKNEFVNTRVDDILNYAMLYDNIGELDEFLERLKQYSKIDNEDELTNEKTGLIALTTKENGVDSPYKNKSISEVNKLLEESYNFWDKTIRSYIKGKQILDNISKGKIDERTLQIGAIKFAQAENWEERSNELFKQIKEALNKYKNSLYNLNNKNINIILDKIEELDENTFQGYFANPLSKNNISILRDAGIIMSANNGNVKIIDELIIPLIDLSKISTDLFYANKDINKIKNDFENENKKTSRIIDSLQKKKEKYLIKKYSSLFTNISSKEELAATLNKVPTKFRIRVLANLKNSSISNMVNQYESDSSDIEAWNWTYYHFNNDVFSIGNTMLNDKYGEENVSKAFSTINNMINQGKSFNDVINIINQDIKNQKDSWNKEGDSEKKKKMLDLLSKKEELYKLLFDKQKEYRNAISKRDEKEKKQNEENTNNNKKTNETNKTNETENNEQENNLNVVQNIIIDILNRPHNKNIFDENYIKTKILGEDENPINEKNYEERIDSRIKSFEASIEIAKEGPVDFSKGKNALSGKDLEDTKKLQESPEIKIQRIEKKIELLKEIKVEITEKLKKITKKDDEELMNKIKNLINKIDNKDTNDSEKTINDIESALNNKKYDGQWASVGGKELVRQRLNEYKKIIKNKKKSEILQRDLKSMMDISSINNLDDLLEKMEELSLNTLINFDYSKLNPVFKDNIDEIKKIVNKIIEGKNTSNEEEIPNATNRDYTQKDIEEQNKDKLRENGAFESIKDHEAMKSDAVTMQDLRNPAESYNPSDEEGKEIQKLVSENGGYDFVDSGKLAYVLDNTPKDERESLIKYIRVAADIKQSDGSYKKTPIYLLAIEYDGKSSIDIETKSGKKKYQIVGSLARMTYKGSENEASTNSEFTIRHLIDKELGEISEQKNKFEVSEKYSNAIITINAGRPVFGNEQNVGDVLSSIDFDDFEIGYYNEDNLVLHKSVIDSGKIIVEPNPNNERPKNGSVYIFIKGADGRYYPRLLKIKRFSEECFNKTRNILDFVDDDFIDSIRECLKIIIDTTESDYERAFQKYLLSTLLVFRKGKKEDGKEHSVVPISFKKRKLSDNGDSFDYVQVYGNDEIILSYEGDKDKILDKLLRQLSEFNLRVNVHFSSNPKINDNSYNDLKERIITNNIATTNLLFPRGVNSNFEIFLVDKDGKIKYDEDKTRYWTLGNKIERSKYGVTTSIIESINIPSLADTIYKDGIKLESNGNIYIGSQKINNVDSVEYRNAMFIINLYRAKRDEKYYAQEKDNLVGDLGENKQKLYLSPDKSFGISVMSNGTIKYVEGEALENKKIYIEKELKKKEKIKKATTVSKTEEYPNQIPTNTENTNDTQINNGNGGKIDYSKDQAKFRDELNSLAKRVYEKEKELDKILNANEIIELFKDSAILTKKQAGDIKREAGNIRNQDNINSLKDNTGKSEIKKDSYNFNEEQKDFFNSEEFKELNEKIQDSIKYVVDRFNEEGIYINFKQIISVFRLNDSNRNDYLNKIINGLNDKDSRENILSILKCKL